MPAKYAAKHQSYTASPHRLAGVGLPSSRDRIERAVSAVGARRAEDAGQHVGAVRGARKGRAADVVDASRQVRQKASGRPYSPDIGRCAADM